MNCAKRRVLYAVCVGLCALSPLSEISAKDNKESNSSASVSTTDAFQWNEHSKLSWDDFLGPVNAASDESAAATHCGIGFKVVKAVATAAQEVVVFNTFYTHKSWVRADARIGTILEHEQGHFDLCEIYTRKLRAEMNHFDFNVTDVRKALMDVYSSVSRDYESAQENYERETIHGTNIPEQKKWQSYIATQLTGNEHSATAMARVNGQ